MGLHNASTGGFRWLYAGIPLLGAVTYLALRAPLEGGDRIPSDPRQDASGHPSPRQEK
jgi:hypothetical protein